MTDVEKLVLLLGEGHLNFYENFDPQKNYYKVLAEHLLANGVRLETKQATSDKASEWISVEERLPEKPLSCIVYRRPFNWFDYCVSFAAFDPCYRGEFGNPMNGKAVWYDYDSEYGDYKLSNITHWMPLPEPPKERMSRSSFLFRPRTLPRLPLRCMSPCCPPYISDDVSFFRYTLFIF